MDHFVNTCFWFQVIGDDGKGGSSEERSFLQGYSQLLQQVCVFMCEGVWSEGVCV